MSVSHLISDEQELLAALDSVEGIVATKTLRNADRDKVLEIEERAGKQAFMGLGCVVNTGVALVLSCQPVFVCLTDMTFDWGCQSALILTKEGRLAGEEIRDESRLTHLQEDPNAWFMHPNFVIYKDRIDFPRDLMRNRCRFEIPALPADWWVWRDEIPHVERWSAMPATPSDLFLKKRYFDVPKGDGFGTVLVGARPRLNKGTDE